MTSPLYGKSSPKYEECKAQVGTVGAGVGCEPGQFRHESLHQIAWGEDGTIWAPDMHNHCVHQFETSLGPVNTGDLVKTIGGGSEENERGATVRPGLLRRPYGIAVAKQSKAIYVGEYGNDRISEFNSFTGNFVKLVDTPGLEMPCGMSLSADEKRLAVACVSRNTVMVFTLDGSAEPVVIGAATIVPEGGWTEENPAPVRPEGYVKALFRTPCDVSFTPDGKQLMVAEKGSADLQVVNLDGSVARKLELGGHARAVCFAPDGNILACISQNVKVFDSEGVLLHDKLAGLVVGMPSYCGLTVDGKSGRIAVGNRGGGKVHLL